MYQNYLIVSSIEEAIKVLQNDAARVIAGGTDLMIAMKEGETEYNTLVDITQIPQLRKIYISDNKLIIGASATFYDIEVNGLICQHVPSLSQAAAQVGSPQIRNVATLGGNIVNAMPAADGATALFALSAEIEIMGTNGTKIMPIADCYKGIGQSAINSEQEVVTAIVIPLDKVGKNIYKRFALRKSLALPVVAAAAALKVENHKNKNARMVLSPAGKMPWIAQEMTKELQGMPLEKRILLDAASKAAATAPFRDSPVRCSAAYKRQLAGTLLRDAVMDLYEAWLTEEAI